MLPAIRRVWAMPSPLTFGIKPIRELLDRYLQGVSVDPFARDSRLATHRNDLNPNTVADYHLDAVEFCDKLIADEVQADVVLLDPPYSARQVRECYDNVGRHTTQRDTQRSPFINGVKDRIDRLLRNNGIVISCGWNTVGMGIVRGYEQIEILLVCHGGMHNDTLVTVERKI